MPDLDGLLQSPVHRHCADRVAVYQDLKWVTNQFESEWGVPGQLQGR
jgi:hypothetical protein